MPLSISSRNPKPFHLLWAAGHPLLIASASGKGSVAWLLTGWKAAGQRRLEAGHAGWSVSVRMWLCSQHTVLGPLYSGANMRPRGTGPSSQEARGSTKDPTHGRPRRGSVSLGCAPWHHDSTQERSKRLLDADSDRAYRPAEAVLTFLPAKAPGFALHVVW